MTKKITKFDLNKIADLCNNYYKQDSNGELDHRQFMAQCWVKAVMGELAKEVEIELPERKSQESVFED